MRIIALLWSGAALASAALASSGCHGDGVDDTDDEWGEGPRPSQHGEDEIGDCDDSGHDPGHGPGCTPHDPREPHDNDDERPGAAEPACEVEFPTLEPIWLVEEPSPVAGGLPTVLDLLVTDDALYIANWHNANDAGRSLGSLERRTLDGTLVWAIELERAPNRLAWDGQHLYAPVGHQLRRWSPDGVEDEWRYVSRGSIRDIAVGYDTVALVGSYTVGGGHDSHFDAFFGQVSKTMPLEYLGYAVPTDGVDDVAEAVALNPWGGWIAAGSTRGSKEHVWLRGYAGHRLVGSMQNFAGPHVEAMIPGEGVLYVVGWANASNSGRWLSALDADANELWSRDLWFCPGVRSSFTSLVEDQGRVLGVARPRGPDGEFLQLIVDLSLDGTIADTWSIARRDLHFDVKRVATHGNRIFIAATYYSESAGWRRAIAEVVP